MNLSCVETNFGFTFVFQGFPDLFIFCGKYLLFQWQKKKKFLRSDIMKSAMDWNVQHSQRTGGNEAF